MRNQVQLITYADRLGGTLPDLATALDGSLGGLFGGVHLLPFFRPYDGADAGFDPEDHTEVDARLGSWDDVRALGERFDTVVDVIVNHVSDASPQFTDYLAKRDESEYAGMFLTLDRVFPEGATEAELLTIYRPRPGLPFTPVTFADRSRALVWTTFTPHQVDIDVAHPRARAYLQSVLRQLADSGVSMVRMDAVGYAVKQAGSSSFMTPETFAFVDELTEQARELGLEVLVEVHSHYALQVEIGRKVDWVYDFAIPPLLLHALFTGESRVLRRWLEIRPTNAITVLDTHDGIGVIDVGADANDPELAGLLDAEQIDTLVETIHANSQGESRQATGAAASNLDLYQVNCTYYDALGRDDARYLLTRLIQLFVPGIPQVYYVGLLAGENDMELLARTGVGRDVNRRSFADEDVANAIARPVVQALFALIRFRNAHPAFGGTFELLSEDDGPGALGLRWRDGDHEVRLDADLGAAEYRVTYTHAGDRHEATDVAALPASIA